MTKVWLWNEYDGEGNAISTGFNSLVAYVKENYIFDGEC